MFQTSNKHHLMMTDADSN